MSENVSIGAALVQDLPERPTRLDTWRAGLVKETRNNWQLHVMILPVLVGFFLFRFYPLYGLQIAFKDYNIVAGIKGSDWVGLENFLKFFEDPFFFRVVKNTVVLGFWTLVISYPLPIVFAVLLNEVKQQHGLFKRVTQSISYLPHFIAVVVIVGLIYDFFSFDGIVNQIAVALTGEKWRILGASAWFRPLYVGSVLWQGIGWGSIIYLAALTSIPPEQYESAIVDGRIPLAAHPLRHPARTAARDQHHPDPFRGDNRFGGIRKSLLAAATGHLQRFRRHRHLCLPPRADQIRLQLRRGHRPVRLHHRLHVGRRRQLYRKKYQ